MKIHNASAVVIGLAFVVCASAQTPDAGAPAQPVQPQSAGQLQRGQRGFGFQGQGVMGRLITGTVTAVADDHYAVKTSTGDTYTIHFSANTRILKQAAGQGGAGRFNREGGQAPGEGGGQQAWNRGQGQGRGFGGNPPQQIKASDIKVGDVISATGDVDAAAKSVGALAIVQLDPERARQMEAMEASYGKTWLMGKVTAIDGVKVTLMGSVDNAPHSFVADENTTFRRRRDPITLADIQVGDTIRADGAVKDGVFTATAVNAMGMAPGGNPAAAGPENAPNAPQQ